MRAHGPEPEPELSSGGSSAGAESAEPPPGIPTEAVRQAALALAGRLEEVGHGDRPRAP